MDEALAAFENANSLALEMGHRDADMIFENYRQAVTKTKALPYWELLNEAATRRGVWARLGEVGDTLVCGYCFRGEVSSVGYEKPRPK